MANGDETADSYKMSAEFLLTRRGDKVKIINFLFRAAGLYGEKNRNKAVECLDEIHNNVRGSTVEFGMVHYFRYLHRLAKSYEDLEEHIKSADIYSELAKEIYKLRESLESEKIFSHLEIFKKFTAYLAKALNLYDSVEKYDSILKLARAYYKVFPELQENESIHSELFFCYEHIIAAADITGSRYFREYYDGLNRQLRGIPLEYETELEAEKKGPYT